MQLILAHLRFNQIKLFVGI